MRALEPLPAGVGLSLRSPNLGAALSALTALVRHVRPVPDLRALVQLGLSGFEPSADLDAPFECLAHREPGGAWGWVVLLAARTSSPGPADADGTLGWRTRPWRGETIQSTHLRPDLLVFTDDPTWVVTHRAWLGSPRPAASGGSDLLLRVTPGVLIGPDAHGSEIPGVEAEPETERGPAAPGALAAAWLAQATGYEIAVDFRPAAVEVGVRMRPNPATALAQGLPAARGLERALFERMPAAAPLMVAGDARALAGTAVGPLLGSAPLLSLVDALADEDAPTPPGALDVGDALAPLLARVRREFLYSLQTAPGAKHPSLFLAARVTDPAPPPGPVAYHLPAGDVHRLDGASRFLPADIVRTGDWFLAAGGEAPRALLEGLLSGRLATGLSANPTLAPLAAGVTAPTPAPAVIMLASADLAALVDLFAPGRLSAAATPIAPLTWRLQTDGELLEGRLSVPHGQLDRIAPLLRRKAPRPGPESTDWLFPEGI